MPRGSSRGSSSSRGASASPSRPSRLFGTKPAAPAAAPTTTRAPAAAPPAPAAAPHAPAPMAQAPAPMAAPAPSMGGGMGGGFLSNMMGGLQMGIGSAVGHRLVDGVMGPRTVVHEHTNGPDAPAAAAAPAAADSTGSSMLGSVPAMAAPVSTGEVQACNLERQEFERCMRNNNSNMEACKNIYDVLFSCQQTMKNYQ